jgi:hypothetical protein
MHCRDQRGDRRDLEAGPGGNARGDTAITAGCVYTACERSSCEQLAQPTANFGGQHFMDFEKIFFDVSLIFSNWYYKVQRKSTR